MIKSRTLLATFAALAVASGAAQAEIRPDPSGSTRQAYSASATEASGPGDAALRSGSSAALSALLRDWDRADFSAPSKPSQSRVYGRDGYVTSGPGYNAMVVLIRSAISEAREGHDQEAFAMIAKVRTLLGPVDGESTVSQSRMARLGS